MATALNVIGRKLKAFFWWTDRDGPPSRLTADREGLMFIPHQRTRTQSRRRERNVVEIVHRTLSEPTRTQNPRYGATRPIQRNHSVPQAIAQPRTQQLKSAHRTVRHGVATTPVKSPKDSRGRGFHGLARQGDPHPRSPVDPSSSPIAGHSASYGNRDKPLPPLPNNLQQQSAEASFFSNAHDLTIPSLNIQNVQNASASKTIFDLLEPHVSHGASHDSNERCAAPKCDPHTRIAVQEEIVGWIRDGDRDAQPKKIMWLAGPAGSGKTAIAGSVAETCKKRGLLAASFFISSFSGSADRRSKRPFIATLAHHLAGHPCLQDYKAVLQKAMELNPDVFHKNLKEQAEYLVLGPLRFIRGNCDPQTWPKGILIDGLDEVEAEKSQDSVKRGIERADSDDQLEILDVLFTLASDSAFPFRIFIASRPEQPIDDFFSTTADEVTIKLFLGENYNPDADIERFLKSKFAAIRRQFAMSDPLWPGQRVVDRIVDMSSGQFIVPTTLLRYIRSGLPQQQLHIIMQLEGVKAEIENPFAVLDALYLHILNRSPDPRLAVTWMQCIVSCSRTGNPTPALFWRQFLEDVEGQFNYLLGPLSSLVTIPPLGNHTSPVTIHHKSLNDFWSSTVRCGDLYVERASVNAFAGAKCVDVLKNKGPTIPLRSKYAVRQFMKEFLSLASLLRPSIPANLVPHSKPVSTHFAQFLGYLSDDSKATLASCDAAWWTQLLLVKPSSSIRITCPIALRTLAGIYCGIHFHLCEASETVVQCHPACTHWRTGILAEAKALGWCCHKLEAVPIELLARTTREGFEERFVRMCLQFRGSVVNCSICRPHWQGGEEDRSSDEDGEQSESQSSSYDSGSHRNFSGDPHSPGTSEDDDRLHDRKDAVHGDSGIVLQPVVIK